jgi:hypothetical protein
MSLSMGHSIMINLAIYHEMAITESTKHRNSALIMYWLFSVCYFDPLELKEGILTRL